MKYSRDMLPCLGVTWHYFETETEALAFAQWAEDETRYDNYPCEAFVMRDDEREQQFEVKVRNW